MEHLLVTVTESGELEAQRRRIISNELRWPVIIKTVAPQGLLKPGETIIEFECKELLDAIVQQELAVTSADNDYTQARESRLLKVKEMANKVSNAAESITDAGENLKRYEEKGREIAISDAKRAIQLAEETLRLARKKLLFKQKANADPELNKPYSRNEIEADQLAVDRLELAWKKAESQKEMLEKYDQPKEIRKLNRAVTEAELDLDRAKLESKTQLLIAKSREEAKKATRDMKRDRLKEMREDERKLVVKTETEGLVVYNTGGSRWRPSNVQVQVGEKINPRQQLMIIPDMSTLKVTTKVYEARISEVKPGLKAYITLDSRPDRKLTGRVDKVAVLPDTQHRWLNPGVKVFNVIVSFDENIDDLGLKPGMGAQVELVLAHLTDVLTLPIAAVFTEQEKTYCYRVEGETASPVVVQIGKMNNKKVQILSGLAEGDRVLLTPPAFTRDGRRKPSEKPAPAPEPPSPSTQPAGNGGAAPAPDKPARRPRSGARGAGGAGRPSRPTPQGAHP